MAKYYGNRKLAGKLNISRIRFLEGSGVPTIRYVASGQNPHQYRPDERATFRGVSKRDDDRVQLNDFLRKHDIELRPSGRLRGLNGEPLTEKQQKWLMELTKRRKKIQLKLRKER